MRPGLHVGSAAALRLTVRQDMVATFEELGPTHPVYATWNLVRHMEEASRKLVLPFLDHDEETIGYAVEVVHLGSALVGSLIEVTAYLRDMDGRHITCDVAAHCGYRLIGRGRTVQVLTSKVWLSRRLADLEQEQP